MDNIFSIGATGHAKVMINVVELEQKYTIVGLIDHQMEVGGQTPGYTILGKESDLPRLVNQYKVTGVLIAIGDNFVRSTVADDVTESCPDLIFLMAVHPDVCIGKKVFIGAGTVIMAGAIVNACCTVGRFCILHTNSSLDHESVMDDFSSLAPRVATEGNCAIGSQPAISIGATLIHGIKIGSDTVIGASATMLQNIDNSKVAYGTPAKPIRDRAAGEKFL